MVELKDAYYSSRQSNPCQRSHESVYRKEKNGTFDVVENKCGYVSPEKSGNKGHMITTFLFYFYFIRSLRLSLESGFMCNKQTYY